jgi:hypothetical protein
VGAAVCFVDAHQTTSRIRSLQLRKSRKRPTDGEMTGAFDEINQLPGVLSAALVRCKSG